jgi:hypothetical protein
LPALKTICYYPDPAVPNNHQSVLNGTPDMAAKKAVAMREKTVVKL